MERFTLFLHLSMERFTLFLHLGVERFTLFLHLGVERFVLFLHPGFEFGHDTPLTGANCAINGRFKEASEIVTPVFKLSASEVLCCHDVPPDCMRISYKK